MTEMHFNLIHDPWIRVVDMQNQEKLVSLEKLFNNSANYRQLAGEMKAQDLAILRFLLAILTTVYSRFNAAGEAYEWLEIDENTYKPTSYDEDEYADNGQDDLLETWQQLFERRSFTPILKKYLEKYSKQFELLGGEQPFYQVTKEQYDAAVPENKTIEKGKGTVAIKQLNRTISESNNSPDIFSPRTPLQKNQITIDEFTRWLITYQSYTAVTDKTKVETKDKFSISKGWLYGLNPVFASGKNLFETLMLNLVLFNLEDEEQLKLQTPFWEYSMSDYLQRRKDGIRPDNIAELYTIWSRIIYINWQENNPIVFSAGLPKIDGSNAFIEPMTSWRYHKKTKDYTPNPKETRNLDEAMWRNFGQYIKLRDNTEGHEPGIVKWLNLLTRNKLLNNDGILHLTTVGLISDGNATSQSPAAEVTDEMQIRAGVLFDKDDSLKNYWPARIEDAIELTKKVGNYFLHFAENEAELRDVDKSSFSNYYVAKFYERLNEPFYHWLASLTNHDERDQKVNEWKQVVHHVANQSARELFNAASPQEIRGKEIKERYRNIFLYYRQFNLQVIRTLGETK